MENEKKWLKISKNDIKGKKKKIVIFDLLLKLILARRASSEKFWKCKVHQLPSSYSKVSI